jgi:hypothetical protein
MEPRYHDAFTSANGDGPWWLPVGATANSLVLSFGAPAYAFLVIEWFKHDIDKVSFQAHSSSYNSPLGLHQNWTNLGWG